MMGRILGNIDRTPRRQRHPVLRRVALRIAFLPVALFVLLTLAFFIVNIFPSDPAKVVLGALATKKQLAEFNKAQGLDGSVWTRYVRYLNGAIHGTLGHSYYDGTSILNDIRTRLASTLELVVLGFLVAWIIGTGLGVLSAYYRGSWIDGAVRALVSLMQSVPDFVIGLLGATLLAFTFKLLPAPLGQLPVTITPPHTITGAAFLDSILDGDWNATGAAAKQLVLPVLALGIFNSVVFARTVRATMAEALDSPYIEFARSRGLREWTIVRLSLRSCLVPAIAYSGVVVASLLSGTAVVETAFSWEGLGQWAITGILRSDLPVAEGFVLVCGVFVVLIYLASELITMAVEPRLRLGTGGGLRLGGSIGETTALAVAPSLEPELDDLVMETDVEPVLTPVGAGYETVLLAASTPALSYAGGGSSEGWMPTLAVPSSGVGGLADGAGPDDGPGPAATVPAAAHTPAPPPKKRLALLRRATESGWLQVGLGLGVVLLFILAAFFAPLPHNPTHPFPDATLVPPSGRFWLGTDSSGFDVFSRVIAAAKNDIPIGLAGALIGAVVGTPLGLAVSSEGRWSEVIMRIVDLFQSLPVVLVAVVLAASSNGGSSGVIVAIALVNTPLFIRIVRAGAQTIRSQRYVEAARAAGASPSRIAFRHVLPNVIDLVLAQLSISIAFAILAIAALSYLGAGLSLTTPTWGGMISQGASVIGSGAWWTVVPPAVAIAITVLCFNLVADGLQRVFSINGRRS